MKDDSSVDFEPRFGSKALDKIVTRLKSTSDPRRRYEYVLWLAKALPPMSDELRIDAFKVNGCISTVHVVGELVDGRLLWHGDSDALITRGLLALLIKGLTNLTTEEVMGIDPSFISETGLQGSLTPSRANGFLNIFRNMQGQSKRLGKGILTSSS